MNEEVKIIIKAVTDEAKKSIKGIKDELDKVKQGADGSAKGISAAMKGIGKGALIAVAAVAAVGAAIIALGKNSLEFQKNQAKLVTAFQSVGSSAKQAAESYKNLFRFMGDADTSVEAAAHLAKLTTNQKDLAEWTKICQGVYSTFGDSLKIEALTEAANETARIGTVTGVLADALNWAGVSEDEFNAKLARTTSFEEREALIRNTLNGLYSTAAELYEKNNKDVLEYNESQAKMQNSMAATGKAITPLLTALNNLSAVFFVALKPALDAIIPAIATFVNWLTTGIQATLSFFGVVSSAGAAVGVFSNIGGAISNAATGANKLSSGIDGVSKAAEKAKKAAAGFDELNVVSSGTSAASGASGAAGGYMTPAIDASQFTVDADKTEGKASAFVSAMKRVAGELKTFFAPVTETLTNAFNTVLVPAFELVQTVITDTFKILSDTWNTYGKPFTDKLTEALDHIIGTILDYANTYFLPILNKVLEVLNRVWTNGIKPLVESTVKGLAELGILILDIYNKHLAPIIDLIIAKVYPIIRSVIESILDSLGNIATFIGLAATGVIDMFRGVIQFLSGVFTGDWAKAWDGIKQIFSGRFEAFANIAKAAWEAIKLPFKAAGTYYAGVWKNIKDAFGNVSGWFKDKFTAAWTAVKNVFSTGGKIFDGIKDGILNGLKAVVNGLIDGINRVVKVPFDGLNTALKKIRDISIVGLKPFSWISTISVPQIPKLARGGIVDQATLAMIGERGKEAVVPLENNTEWLDKLAEKLSSVFNTPSKIVLMLDGKELGWANINSINNITRQTGALQLVMS